MAETPQILADWGHNRGVRGDQRADRSRPGCQTVSVASAA